jgi:hypothetical protein
MGDTIVMLPRPVTRVNARISLNIFDAQHVAGRLIE